MTVPNVTGDRQDLPNRRNEESKAMIPDLQRSRDVFAGFSRLQAKAQEYLPKHAAEDSTDYSIRLKRPAFFNAYARTIKGLVGMVFRQDPEPGEDIPAGIIAHMENIDNAGTHFDVFVKTLFEDAVVAGHVGIMVDVPRVDGDAAELSLADESALGIRPYWVMIRKEDIISWRHAVVMGRQILQQVVLYEASTEPDGEFKDRVVERYRQIRNDDGVVTWKLWVKVDEGAGERYTIESEGPITNQTEIPLAMIYTNKTGPMVSAPPLSDLVWTNLKDYQVQSDYLHAAHIANVPILVVKGADSEEFTVGPNSAAVLPADGDLFWAETSGAGMAAARQIIQDNRTEMAILGLSMLQHETRSAETAEAKRIDKSEQDSALATAARSLQDGIEQALSYHAKFMKLPEGGSVAINREFTDEPISADQVREWSNLVANGQLSLDSLWALMAERGALPDEFDPDIEHQRIESDMGPEPVTEIPE